MACIMRLHLLSQVTNQHRCIHCQPVNANACTAEQDILDWLLPFVHELCSQFAARCSMWHALHCAAAVGARGGGGGKADLLPPG